MQTQPTMLSILIPVKDYDCRQLVQALHRQGEALGMPFEILLGEDGTSPQGLMLNSEAEHLTCCRRIISHENIGRARIRNLLAREAQYPYIIFIDSDAVVEKEDFLHCYAQALKENVVVCGSLYHAAEQPDEACSLRYKYEKEADRQRDALTRSKAPYDRFTTFNFAIRKEVFTSILFDESITRYGYEDALFGKKLERRGIEILHIDNKLLHSGLESNAIFLKKTEQALATLAAIKEKIARSPLLDAVEKLRRYHMTGIFMAYWRARRKNLLKNLNGKHPSLLKFKIYKIGYYISISHK